MAVQKHQRIPQFDLMKKMHEAKIITSLEGECHGFSSTAIYYANFHSIEEFDHVIINLSSQDILTPEDIEFLEKIHKIQLPEEFPEIFGHKKLQRPSHVSTIFSEKLVSSIKKGRMCSFIDCKDIFDDLRASALKQKASISEKPLPLVCLHLTNKKHAMAVVYDMNSDMWYYLEPNNMPFQRIKGSDTESMVEQIFHGYRVIKTERFRQRIAMGFQFYTKAAHEIHIKNITNEWVQSDSMSRTYNHFTKVRDNNGTSLLEITSRVGDHQTTEMILDEMILKISQGKTCDTTSIDNVFINMYKLSFPEHLLKKALKLCDASPLENISEYILSRPFDFNLFWSLLSVEQKQKISHTVIVHSLNLKNEKFALQLIDECKKNNTPEVFFETMATSIAHAIEKNDPKSVIWLLKYIDDNAYKNNLLDAVKRLAPLVKSSPHESLLPAIRALCDFKNDNEIIYLYNTLYQEKLIELGDFFVHYLIVKTSQSSTDRLHALIANRSNLDIDAICCLFKLGANPFIQLKSERSFVTAWQLADPKIITHMLDAYLKSPNPKKDADALSDLLSLGIKEENKELVTMVMEKMFNPNDATHINVIKQALLNKRLDTHESNIIENMLTNALPKPAIKIKPKPFPIKSKIPTKVSIRSLFPTKPPQTLHTKKALQNVNQKTIKTLHKKTPLTNPKP